MPKAIWMELMDHHHDNPLANYFGIEKTYKLLAWKYFWPSLRHNIKAYVKGYNVCLALKAMRHKPYGDLQSLPVLTHWWKDLSINFVTDLSILTDWKKDSYNSILVIFDWLTKMVHYELAKINIDVLGLAKVIIDVVVWHHGPLNLIVTNKDFLFNLKFWSLLCYFPGIKRRSSTAFHPQTYGQTKWQNSIMKAYFRAFVNIKQNDWVRLLPMAEFTYNNAINASTSYMPFELNCSYHLCVFFKKNTNLGSQSKTAKELSSKLTELMTVY